MTKATKEEIARNNKPALANRNDKFPSITKLVKIKYDDKPVWKVTIDGSPEVMETNDIKDINYYAKFNDMCAAQLSRSFEYLDKKAWAKMVAVAFTNIEYEDPEKDTTQLSRFMGMFRTYLTNKQRAVTRDQLIPEMAPPFEDDDEDVGLFYFKFEPLMLYLKRRDMKIDMHTLQGWIRKLGGGTKGLTIKGERVRVRCIRNDLFRDMPEMDTPELPENPIG